MFDIFGLLSGYIGYFPLIAFIGLVLAGCNLPVSEDLIIITGALLSHEEPSIMVPTLIAIYIGVVSTDFLMYWLGGRVRRGASKKSFFIKVIPERAMDKMHRYLDKYGIFTFIVGRFIPFGFRNTMFFSSGFFKLRFRDFVIYDLVAAGISVNTLFFVTYWFGENARKPLRIAGIILFVVVVSGFITLIIRFVVLWRRRKKDNEQPTVNNEQLIINNEELRKE